MNPSRASHLDFGIFDWIDDAGRDPAENYSSRLKLLEYADRAGFWGYHLAEHHGTPLGTAPSPNIFLAAAAARTTRIRLGALVNVITMYQPLRLIEEICMLDQISAGRLEVGFGRGASPVELGYYGVDASRTRDIYAEAFELILRALRTGVVETDGQYFRYPAARLSVAPRQLPHPPLWYPTTNVDTIPWLGRNAINTLFGFVCDLAFARAGTTVGAQTALYERELADHAGDPERLNAHLARPHYGISRHVHVADSDERALRAARPAHDRFFESFNRLWLDHQGTSTTRPASRTRWTGASSWSARRPRLPTASAPSWSSTAGTTSPECSPSGTSRRSRRYGRSSCSRSR